jgi:hypothetical protein
MRQLADLADHPGQARPAQAFLHRRQDPGLVAGLGEDHPLGRQADLGQGRGEKIALAQAPQHIALGAGQQARREARGRGAVQRAVGPAGHLVQRAKRQTPARQPGVQGRYAERQHRARRAVLGFEGADLTAKRVERGGGEGGGHDDGMLLFHLCSYGPARVNQPRGATQPRGKAKIQAAQGLERNQKNPSTLELATAFVGRPRPKG